MARGLSWGGGGGEGLRREPSETRKSTLKPLLRGKWQIRPRSRERRGKGALTRLGETSSIGDLLIPVLFRHQHGVCECRVHAGGRVDLLSVLRFIPIGVFDDATVRTIGRAFELRARN